MNEMNNGENNFNNENQNNDNYQQQSVNNVQLEQSVDNQELPKKEEKKSYCGLLIVFMAISLLLAGFIVYDKCLKKEEVKEPEKTKEPIKNEDETNKTPKEITDEFYGTYDENSITFTGEKNGEYFIRVKSISGLKDKNIEKIVNDKIASINNKVEVKSGIKSTSPCYPSIYANFGNLLSLHGSCNNGSVYLNLNLNNGEELKIEDLFVANADVENIILTTGIHIVYNEEDEFAEPEFVVGVTEEKIVDEIRNKKYNFYFDNLGVYIETESDEEIIVSIADNLDNFVYFDKYKGNEIFENNSIGKKGLSKNARGKLITKLSGNAYIDVLSWEEFTSSPLEIKKALVEYLASKTKNDNDGFIKVITGDVDLSYNFYKNSKSTIEVLASKKIIICKATSDYIQSTEFKTKVIESRFTGSTFGEGYLFFENLSCEKLPNFAIYYTDNNYKVYENAKDIFVDGFDGEKYLKENIYDKAAVTESEYTEEEIKEMEKTDKIYGLNYELTTYGINLIGYEPGDKIRYYNQSFSFKNNTDVYNHLRIFDDLKIER